MIKPLKPPCRALENKQTSLRSREMHPYPRLRRYFPRRGKSALRFPLESCGTLLSTHSPTASVEGKVVRQHQRGCRFSITRQGGCMVFQRAKRVWLVFLRAIARLYGFIILAPLLFEGRPPLCREAAGPFGNNGKHRPADWYLMPSASLTILTEILRSAQDDAGRRGSPATSH